MQFPRTYEVLAKFGEDFYELVTQQIEDKDGIATGAMMESIGWEIKEEDEGLTLYLTHNDTFSFWNNGTKPHFPWDKERNVNPLEDWIVVKGIQPKPMKIVRTWKTKNGMNGREVEILPTVKQLAFLIGKKIKENGTKPRGAFEYAYENLIGIYEPMIVEAFMEDTLENEGVVMSLNNALQNLL